MLQALKTRNEYYAHKNTSANGHLDLKLKNLWKEYKLAEKKTGFKARHFDLRKYRKVLNSKKRSSRSDWKVVG